jgi:hypothetical protein
VNFVVEPWSIAVADGRFRTRLPAMSDGYVAIDLGSVPRLPPTEADCTCMRNYTGRPTHVRQGSITSLNFLERGSRQRSDDTRGILRACVRARGRPDPREGLVAGVVAR